MARRLRHLPGYSIMLDLVHVQVNTKNLSIVQLKSFGVTLSRSTNDSPQTQNTPRICRLGSKKGEQTEDSAPLFHLLYVLVTCLA